jgi:16S rRNA (guanine(966)-N(2))-methyltransferase RsmD
MRVIAGTHRGRHLAAVPGKGTRPTADKVKESMFNMIGPYFDGGWALDLYAGTGALGIEALSRGAEKAVFVEIDQRAFSVIKQNLTSLKLEGQAELYRMEASRALKLLAKRDIRFDLVFLDPPYARQKIAEEIKALQQLELLADDAWIVAEHDAGITLPEKTERCEVYRSVTYGDTAVTIYSFDPDAPAQERTSDNG